MASPSIISEQAEDMWNPYYHCPHLIILHQGVLKIFIICLHIVKQYAKKLFPWVLFQQYPAIPSWSNTLRYAIVQLTCESISCYIYIQITSKYSTASFVPILIKFMKVMQLYLRLPTQIWWILVFSSNLLAKSATLLYPYPYTNKVGSRFRLSLDWNLVVKCILFLYKSIAFPVS